MTEATPWWGTILVGGLGLLGVVLTAVAGLIGINVSAKRAEQHAADTETRSARRDVYCTFLATLSKLARLADGPAAGARIADVLDLSGDPHIRFQIYASPTVFEAGAQAIGTMIAAFNDWTMSEGTGPMNDSDRARVDDAVDVVRDAIRHELGLVPLGKVRR